MLLRLNEFVVKIQRAKGDARGGNGQGKGRGRGNAKGRGRGNADVGAKHEPTFDNFNDAMAAAVLCTRCTGTKNLTKGCRGCMGTWFEEIRLSHFGGRVVAKK